MLTLYDWTEGKFGVDFDEYGPLPASLDDPRRDHGTHAATFTDWLLVCGLAAVSPMSCDDPRVKTIHHLRALPFHFGKPGWEDRGWRWNGRAEVESAARLSFADRGVDILTDLFAAVWKLYVRWLNSTGRFVSGLDEAAKSVMANEFAKQAAYNHIWGFNGALWDRNRCGYVAEIATLRAALKAQKAPS